MKFTLLPLLILALSSVTASAGLISPTKAEVRKFNKADTDDDEVVSPFEFAALMETLYKARIGRKGDLVGLEAVADTFFDWFDSDDSGDIDLSEWYLARTSTPSDPTLPDVMNLPGLDYNGDEIVKPGEFVQVLKDLIPAKFAAAWFKSLSVN